ncbi:MAG: GAF domain-containing protein, partial [Deltaproteobacteria bacterium]|nr:GAF domain-containing protein [Deltaproteobacteria bacterium]
MRVGARIWYALSPLQRFAGVALALLLGVALAASLLLSSLLGETLLRKASAMLAERTSGRRMIWGLAFLAAAAVFLGLYRYVQRSFRFHQGVEGKLREHSRELEEQVEERIEAFRETAGFLQNIFDHSTDAIIGTDLEGTVIRWNRGAEQLYGWQAEEVLGRPLSIVPSEMEKELAQVRAAVRTGRTFAGIRTRRRRKNGTLVDVSVTLSPLYGASGRVIGLCGISRDISTLVHMEEELRERNQELQGLNRIMEAVSRSLELDEVLDVALEQVLAVTGLDAGYLRVLDAAGHYLPTMARRGCSEVFVRAHLGAHAPELVAGAVVAGRRPLVLDPQAEDLARDGTGPEEGLHAFACIPLLSKEQVLGVLGVGSRDPARRFSPRELDFLMSVGSHLGVIVDNAKLFAEVSRSRHELSISNVVSSTVGQSLNLDEMLNLVLMKVVELLEFEAGWIRLVGETPDELVLRAHVGISPESARVAKRRSAGRGLLATVLARGEAVAIDLRFTAPEVSSGLSRLVGIVTLVEVPLKSKSGVQGLMALGMRQPREISPSVLQLLQAIGSHIAVSIENTCLYQSAETRAREFRALYDVGKTVASTLDSREVLDRIAEQALEVIGAKHCAVFELDRDGWLYPRAARGISGEQPVLPVRLGQGASGAAALARRPVFSEDILDAPPPGYDDPVDAAGHTPREAIARWGLRSVLAVPLIRGDQVFGAICIFWDEVRPRSEGEVALLQMFADQAAIAIDNARLMEATRKSYRDLQVIHEITQAIDRGADLQSILQSAVDNVTRVVERARCFILLHDAAADDLAEVAHSERQAVEMEGLRMAVQTRSLTAWAFRERQTVVVEDPAEDDRTSEEILRRLGRRGVIAIPLLVGECCVGVFGLSDLDGPRRFTGEEVEKATLIARHASIAIARAQLFEEVKARSERLEVLAQVSRGLASTLELRPLGELVLDAIGRLLDVPIVNLWLEEPETGDLVLSARRGMREPWEAAEFRLERGSGLVGWIVEHGQPLGLPDVLEDPRFVLKDWAHDRGVTSYLGVPLHSGGRVSGTISIFSTRRRVFTQDEIDLAVMLADHVAVALENARLFQEVQARSARLEGLISLSRRVTSSLELEALFQAVMAASQQFVPDAVIRLWMLDPEAQELALVGELGSRVEHGGTVLRFKHGEGLVGYVWERRAPYTIAEICEDPKMVNVEWARQEGLRSFLGIPLCYEEAFLGVLTIVTRAPHRFAEDEVVILQAFADEASVALRNAQLFDEARLKSHRLETLARLGQTVNTALDFPRVLELIVEAGAVLVEGAAVRLWRYHEESQELTLVAEHGFPPGGASLITRARLGEALVGAVAAERQVFISYDLQREPRFADKARAEEQGLKAYMGIPLLIGEQLVGQISLFRRTTRPFGQDEINRMRIFANQAAIALRNARLFEELEEANRMLRAQAVTDGLTNLYNHRFFHEALAKEVERARRFGTSVSMAMIDIDFFKFYNDANGHPQGDMVLRAGADLFRRSVRGVDVVARYGGEEFTVIFPETSR